MTFIITLLFFNSLYSLGYFLKEKFLKYTQSFFQLRCLYITIGLIFFQFWCSFLLLFNNKLIFTLGGIFFIILPLILNKKFVLFSLSPKTFSIKNFITHIQNQNISKKIEYLILLLYFFCCLIPITSADSLDYHLGTAFLYLNSNTYDPTWYTSFLALNGEKMITILLAINAKPSIQLIQFIGLINIYQIFHQPNQFFSEKNKLFFSKKIFDILKLSIISSPIFIFLTITAKPQLFPISLILFAFLITFSNKKISENDNHVFITINILLISAILNKLTLFLPALIIYFFYFYKKFSSYSIKRINFKYLVKKILVLFTFIFIFIFPVIIHRFIYYDTDLIKGIFYPLNNFGNYEIFIEWIKSYKENPLVYPFFMVFPYGTSNLTTIIGIAPLVILIISQIYRKFIFFLFMTFNLYLISLFVPNSTRFMLPYFLIFTLMLIKEIIKKNEKDNQYLFYFRQKFILNIISWITILQASLLIFALTYYNYEFFSSALNNKTTFFLEKKINHFDLNIYLSKNLDSEKIIFTDARLRGFSKLNIASLDPFIFKDKDTKNHIIKFSKIKNLKNTEEIYIVNTSDSLIGNLMNKCLIQKPNQIFSKYKTRNPFSKQNNNIINWDIREAKFSELLNCSNEKFFE